MNLFTKKTAFGLFVAAVVLSGASCGPKNAYTITGILQDSTANGKTIYLKDYNSEKPVDSAVVADGKFTFTGTIQSDSIRRVDIPRTRYYANFILEPGNITLNLEPGKYKMSGTANNDVFALIEEEFNKFRTTLDAARKEIKKDTTLTNDQVNELYKLKFDQEKEQLLSFLTGYAKQYPNTSIGTFAIWQILLMDGNNSQFATNKALVDGDTYAKNFTPVMNLVKNGEQLLKTAEGQPFTDFTVKGGSLTGGDVSLSDYVGKGKYILVDFWASWCGPCRAEIPNLQNIYKKYKGNKFDIVSVAVWDEKAETLKAIEEEKLPWIQIINGQEEPAKLYGINGIPHIILFAPDGTIVKRGLRGEGIEAALTQIGAQRTFWNQ